MSDSNDLINKIFESLSLFPSLLHLPPFLSLLLPLLLLLLLSAPSASYAPSVPSTLVPLGRLFYFSRRLPVALSGNIWDVPSSDEESKDKNEDKNKGESEGEDEDKDEDEDEDKDKDENSVPASRLR